MKKKRDDKKGALELSVNTIVIVVIGVTLLTLGLVFVKNMFNQLTQTSDDVFGTADKEIGKMHQESKFTCPTEISVKAGKRQTSTLYVGHDGTCGQGVKEFTVTLEKASDFDETLVKAKLISPATIPLKEGEEATYTMQIAAAIDAPLSSGSGDDPAYSVTVTCEGENYANGAFIINVVKGGGIFG